ncbi:hypothetical protein PC129_g19040 [Phytophthora cactorum]|uniref:Integrase catalytic domain-containing protein n=1 Tax=Phytophthora cactorum TaxID=29920 RepID=A0A8T1E7H0_9STRA|nr:hypothetical protein PC112_g9699 [Phytophthora cactorum]KAG2825990.1 hypothetical protein PC111_g9154 [Phytophthora cactorum]KAG2858600.1 hypothetical protein PC113_g9681 [Phytophthora cactorum]KAG2904876.1 hypothetical protein PC114_g11744 [Phytophthora cactorum]KAG2921317.1 hypothetical protein PC115_g9562 [Phytophthora cactorum]
MAKSTIYQVLDLRDGFYLILMRESDVALTAVSTPSGMLWEWLVMPQGLKNAPPTFNRCVTHLLRSVRDFAPSYFDDVFVHSQAVNGKTDVEVHKEHLRKLLGLMRKYKLYANLKKCIFGASEIPILGCLVGKNGVRPDPEKVRVIKEWPTLSNVKELRQFLGLATYLCKYVENYAGKIHPLSQLLKQEAEWKWTAECQHAFDAVKQGLTEAPILAVADQDRPFHVVCDASDFAIGCALMQYDHESRDRVVYYQSRQLKPAERNYPVHDKELLAMKYALAKCRVYLLGSGPFVVYTDHASLRTAVKSPHISKRMARWLLFFAEYDFRVEYKPGRLNVVADALSRRPDDAVKTADANWIGVERVSAPSSSLIDDVKAAYASDADAKQLLSYASAPSDEARRKLAPHIRARAHRYRVHEGLLLYSAVDDDMIRIVVPNDYDLRMRIMYEYHDSPTAGHHGREKTYVLLTRDFYWNHQYKWVRKYAPLQSLPTPSECWQSIAIDFGFGLPPDSKRRTGVVVFVDRFSKMVHLAAVPAEVTAVQTARRFVDMVFKHLGMPLDIVSDRNPRFTARFWQEMFTLLGTQLSMSTTDLTQTDGQTERVNRVLGDLLKSSHSCQQWSDCLPMAEFAINSSVHASMGHTPFHVNAMRHPHLPSMIGMVASSLSGGGSTVVSEQPQKSADTDTVSAMTTRSQAASCSGNKTANKNYGSVQGTDTATTSNTSVQGTDSAQAGPAAGTNAVLDKPFSTQAMDIVQRRQAVVRFVQDAIAVSVDRQKLNADNVGRGNTNEFEKSSLILLATQNLPRHTVSDFGASKFAPRFTGPFTEPERHGNAYTLDITFSMGLHPTFYVGRLKPYKQHESSNLNGSQRTMKRSEPASRARQRGRTASRPAFQVPLGVGREVSAVQSNSCKWREIK